MPKVVNVSVHGCSFAYANPVLNWWTVQGVPWLQQKSHAPFNHRMLIISSDSWSFLSNSQKYFDMHLYIFFQTSTARLQIDHQTQILLWSANKTHITSKRSLWIFLSMFSGHLEQSCWIAVLEKLQFNYFEQHFESFIFHSF